MYLRFFSSSSQDLELTVKSDSPEVELSVWSSFLDAVDKYDENYFENNDLIIVYFTSSSGSYYYELRNIKVGEKTLSELREIDYEKD